MIDYIDCGGTPYGEDCVQVSKTKDYLDDMKKEVYVYKHQLERMFGNKLVGGMRFEVKWNPHDFGQYASVYLIYDDEYEQDIELATKIENNLPEEWDEESLIELLAKFGINNCP